MPPLLRRAFAPDSVLRIAAMRRLWVVGAVLYTIRWLELLAIGVWAYQASGSATLVATLTLVRLLPMALFGVVLGAAADRLDRRDALVAVVGLTAAASAALALVAAWGALATWHVALASFVAGIGWAADHPVRRVMIGLAVGPQRMGAAMSLDAGTNHAARIVGPIVGGVALATVGLAGTFALCAALLLVAGWLVLRVPRTPVAAPTDGAGWIADFVAGFAESLRVARADPRLAHALAVTIVFNLFGWPIFSMLPVVGQDRLGLGPQGVGLLGGIDGVGALVGAVLVAATLRPARHTAYFVGGMALYLAMIPVFTLSVWPLLSGAALFVMGVGQAAFGIAQATIVFGAAPAHLRSRILGLLTLCIGTAPIGIAHLGLLADAIGVHRAGVVVAAEAFGVLALLHRRSWRR